MGQKVPERRRAAGSLPSRPAEPGGGLRSDVFSRIAAIEPQLSRAHRSIAQMILTCPKEFIEKPIEELAPWIGVSAPTVTRFARVAGCDGLRELKLCIMSGLRVGLRYFEPPEAPSDTSDVVARVIRRAQHAMAMAAHTLDPQSLDRASAMICSARTLYAFGSGGVSSWLIEEVQNRLFRLGVTVVPCPDHLMQMMLAATVKQDDVVLCCSLTGRNPELVKAASVAREYGAATMALTAEGSPLVGAVDLALTTAVGDGNEVFGPTLLRYSSLVVIDALAYLVAQRNGRATQQTLRRIKQQFVSFRDEDDSGPLCD